MAWLAVDSLGNEIIFTGKPVRGVSFWNVAGYLDEVELPEGSIKKLIGKELTWKNDPVEI